MILGIEFSKLVIRASQINDDQSGAALVVLAKDVVGQKGFPFSGGCKDGEVPGLDALLFLIPYILENRNVVLAIIKDDATGIRLVVGVVDQQAQGVLKIRYKQILVR